MKHLNTETSQKVINNEVFTTNLMALDSFEPLSSDRLEDGGWDWPTQDYPEVLLDVWGAWADWTLQKGPNRWSKCVIGIVTQSACHSHTSWDRMLSWSTTTNILVSTHRLCTGRGRTGFIFLRNSWRSSIIHPGQWITSPHWPIGQTEEHL